MKKYTWVIVIALLVGGVLLLSKDMRSAPAKKVLKVGYPGYWNDLVPSLQHTAFADAIMYNQYEALVGEGPGGTIAPVAAKSWEISEDKKTIVFKIDTSKKFSNGEVLTAQHFKDSWEHGLSLDPKSANSSLLDAMYKTKDFESFKKTGSLAGVKVLDNETLSVEFKKPFRMALSYLSGTRMSAFVREGEKYLGTGPYIINPDGENKIRLVRNPHSAVDASFDEVTVEVVKTDNAEEALKSGQIDLYAFAELANLKICYEKTKNVGCQSGSESRHINMKLNGMKGRFFSNPKYRKALQYLLSVELKESYPSSEKFKTRLDPQIYLPFQAGRIDNEEAQNIVNEGKEYVEEFLAATKKNPIFLASSRKDPWFKNWLLEKGVHLTKTSVRIPGKKVYEMNYKTFEPDLLFSHTSVSNGDPDGIYHALGKNGAISTPMVQRENVMKLLEEGRGLYDMEDIKEHYKKVSRAALEEVPFFHFGFLKTVVAYRTDRLKIKKKYKHRDDNRFIAYEAL